MLRRACATTIAVIALLAASAIASFPARASEAPTGVERVLVGFAPGAAAKARNAAVAGGGTVRATHATLGVHVISVPAARADALRSALRRAAGVTYVESDPLLQPTDTVPNDPFFPTSATYGGEWGSFKTQAPKAWDVTTGSSQVKVAIIDSGIAPHPDLAGRLTTGWNVLTGNTDTNDSFGHGTQVAGVAVATSNNGTGVAGYCWTCVLMPVKVYTSSSGAYASDIAAGITWAADHGARVVNVSIAGSNTSSALASSITYARSKGAVVIAAAGNSGCNCKTYPASLSGVISVGGTNQSDTLYSYSNYGSWVSLAAPSQNVTTTLKDPSTGAQWGYAPIGGTSLATPVVSGIAALLASAAPTATPSAIESALVSTTDPVAGTNQVGSGRVNAYKAVQAITGGGGSTPPPPPPPPAAPANTAPPTISGTAQVGSTLSASTGTWSGSPTSYGYQWSRCAADGSACSNVSGATSSSYVLSSADLDRAMRVTVTASNTGGSASSTSAASAAVADTPAPQSGGGTTTTPFSGSLTKKATSKSFSLAAGAGASHAELTFSRCSSLNLSVSGPSGAAVGSTSGGSVLVLDASFAAAGTYTFTVSGSCQTSFTLNVTAAA